MSNSKNHCAMALLIILFLAGACKKNDPGDPPIHEPGDDTTTKVDVYVTGRNDSACYWKNGQQVFLSGYLACAVDVSGDDVYVAGWSQNAAGRYRAKYWKNGVGTYLVGEMDQGRAQDIVVVGNDVYVAGSDKIYGRGTMRACYWKNGVITPLATNYQDSYANKIAIVGNDVYVSGTRRESGQTNRASCYWKNGQYRALNDWRVTDGLASDLAVSNGNVYFFWTTINRTNNQKQNFYSKNGGAAQEILIGEQNVYGFTAEGDDLYFAGATGSLFDIKAIYWKNTTPNYVRPDNLERGYGQYIDVDSGDVYMAGGEVSYTYTAVPLYWKNGIPEYLGDTTKYGVVTDILAVRRKN